MDKLLVTGASGLLGSTIAWTLRNRYEVVGTYHRNPIQIPDCRAIPADVGDRRRAAEVVSREQPAWIIHCAGLDAAQSDRDPLLARALHAEAAIGLAEASKEHGCLLCYISSDLVFKTTWIFHEEDEHTTPHGVLGRTKLDGERALRQSGCRYLVARGRCYGWSARPDAPSPVERLIERVQAGQVVALAADVFSTPLGAMEMAETLADAYEHDLQGVYHVSGSERVSDYEFGLAVARAFSLRADLIRPSFDLSAPDALEHSLSNRRIRHALRRSLPLVDEGLEHFRALRDEGALAALRGELCASRRHAERVA